MQGYKHEWYLQITSRLMLAVHCPDDQFRFHFNRSGRSTDCLFKKVLSDHENCHATIDLKIARNFLQRYTTKKIFD